MANTGLCGLWNGEVEEEPSLQPGDTQSSFPDRPEGEDSSLGVRKGLVVRRHSQSRSHTKVVREIHLRSQELTGRSRLPMLEALRGLQFATGALTLKGNREELWII